MPLDGLEEAKLWVLQLDGGEVVGVAGLELYSDQGLLRSVAVVDSMHNRGYGVALANYVIGESKKCKVQNLFLLTTTAPEFSRNWDSKKKTEKKWSAALWTPLSSGVLAPKLLFF